MFIALNEKQEIVSAMEKESMNKKEMYVCPACKEKVILKAGPIKIPHFAHVSKQTCDASAEGESKYHLSGKKQLYDWLQNKVDTVLLEPYLSTIAQRPDLLFEWKNHQVAVEFQCSPIPIDLVKKRTEGYEALQITPIWIIGANHLNRKSLHVFSLSSFVWQFVSGSTLSPTLYFFCPDSCKLMRVSHLIPISVKQTIASFHVFSRSSHPLRAVWSPLPKPNSISSAWIPIKKRWRLNYLLYETPENNQLRHFLYNARLVPSLIPSEIGLPVHYAYLYETPLFYWQLWIVVELLHPMPVGQTVTLSQVFRIVTRKNKLRIRPFPLMPPCSFELPIRAYMNILCELQIFCKIEEDVYKKVQPFSIPKTLDEAFEWDERTTEMASQMYVQSLR